MLVLERHRVVGVDDAQGTSYLWDLLAGQPVRVAGAVPALVMVAHGARDLAREEWLDDLRAGDGVPAELGRLLVAQAAGLVEHIVGDADAPDVVQESRLRDLLQAALRPAELAAQQQHVGRDAGGVADGIVIARVQRGDQRLEVGDVHGLDRLIEARVLEGEREQGADALEDLAIGAGEGLPLRGPESERAGEFVVDEDADDEQGAQSRAGATLVGHRGLRQVDDADPLRAERLQRLVSDGPLSVAWAASAGDEQ